MASCPGGVDQAAYTIGERLLLFRLGQSFLLRQNVPDRNVMNRSDIMPYVIEVLLCHPVIYPVSSWGVESVTGSPLWNSPRIDLEHTDIHSHNAHFVLSRFCCIVW